MKSKTPAQLLKAARKLLTPPDAWIKGAYARTQYGTKVYSDDSSAAQFCIAGALIRPVRTAKDYAAYRDASALLRATAGSSSIVAFNDRPDTAHEDVLTALDWAIGVEEAGGL